MRTSVMNRINVIHRPATSGFNFSCLQVPQFDATIMEFDKNIEGKDKDLNRFRYRRKQVFQALIMLLNRLCLGKDTDGFFIPLGCQLSWESICFASRRSQVRSLYAPLYTLIAQPGEQIPYKDKVVGSSPSECIRSLV